MRKPQRVNCLMGTRPLAVVMALTSHDTSERLFSDPDDKEDDEEVVDDKEGSQRSGCGGPGPEADTERGREQHSHQHYR